MAQMPLFHLLLRPQAHLCSNGHAFVCERRDYSPIERRDCEPVPRVAALRSKSTFHMDRMNDSAATRRLPGELQRGEILVGVGSADERDIKLPLGITRQIDH